MNVPRKGNDHEKKQQTKQQDERDPKQKDMPSYAEAETKKCNTVKSKRAASSFVKEEGAFFMSSFVFCDRMGVLF